MGDIFIKIFNLAITAGWFVLAVLLLRPLMRRAPKWINCLLWGIVGLRLALPIKFESIFSLVPSAEPLPQNIATVPAPEINSGIGVMNNIVNPIISDSLAPQVGASVNPMQVLLEVAAYIWVIGVALILCYGAISYILLRRKVRASVKTEANVYYCDDVDSPFILGVIFPRIYVPSGMSGEALGHVLAHERAHLRRGDHVWKPIGFALLAVYWFNPLLWVAYALLCRDIEAACDEKVIRMMDADAKKDYSRTLLDCSMHRKRIMACPLAFGEVGVKQRIKSVLNYKKPAFWVIIAALVATLILSVCFLTNPASDVRDLLEPGSGWRSNEDDPYISVSVDNSVKMSGLLMIGGDFYDIRIDYRKDGGSVYAEIFGQYTSSIKKYSEYIANIDKENEELKVEGLLISGKLKARGDDFVLKVKTDKLGIGKKELVFQKTKDSGNRTVKLPSDDLYVNVLDCGSDNRGAKVSFVQAKLEGDDIIFTLKWKNRTFKTQIYGESFEVYRYEGEELALLEPIGYWKEVATGVSAFSMTYPSFNVTEHYDIGKLGKYRLVAGDAWVDFEVTTYPEDNGNTLGSNVGLELPKEPTAFGNGLYVTVIDYGCEVEGVEISFDQAKRDGDDLIFTLNWKNDTDKSHMVGPGFEVSRFDGKDYVPLDHKNAWIYVAYEVAPKMRSSQSYNITEHYDISATGKYRFYSNGAWVDFLVMILPESYLELDASNGLDVYVWQMGQGGYSFAVYPHSVKPENRIFLAAQSADVSEMRAILSTYDIDDEDIYIVPWQNSISSYIGDYWQHWVAIENIKPYQDMYLAIVRDMLLSDNPHTRYPNIYESKYFDVDGDGVKEFNQVCLGLVDGRFMFSYVVSKDGATAYCFDNFYTEPMSLKFVESNGKVYLHGKTESGNVKTYSISVKDGKVDLTEID